MEGCAVGDLISTKPEFGAPQKRRSI